MIYVLFAAFVIILSLFFLLLEVKETVSFIVHQSLLSKDFDFVAKIIFYLDKNNKDFLFAYKEDGEWLVFNHTRSSLYTKKIKLSEDYKSITYKH